MKELSIDQKAKRYDEVLERVRELLSRCIDDRDRKTKVYRVEDIESIFPEIKEGGDERIRKALIEYFKHVRYNGLDLKTTNVDEVLFWLEKQGKHLSLESTNKI